MTATALKRIRKGLDLTQTEFAGLLGLTQGSIAQMELGIRPIERVTVMAIEHLACKKRKPRRKGKPN